MALVKTSTIGTRPETAKVADAAAPASGASRAQDRLRHRQQKLAERIGAATAELANGMQDAAAAAEELRRSLEQIAAGAEEAAGAAQESLAAIQSVGANFTRARAAAEAEQQRIERLQSGIHESAAQLEAAVLTIAASATRHRASVNVIERLEQQAESIGETTLLVATIADRTNLVALNAAIQAARAGEGGRGFTVVAEEVRGLAEIAERSARDVKGLSVQIVHEVKALGERIRGAGDAAEATIATTRAITADLVEVRNELASLTALSQSILTAAVAAELAAREAGKGAAMVAEAAEVQSAATIQSQHAVQQQAEALDMSQTAARSLAELADDLGTIGAAGGSSGQVGSTAEELSATVQEIAGAASQILIAMDQISRGAQSQASATQQTDAALLEIGRIAAETEKNAAASSQRTGRILGLLEKNRSAVDTIVQGFRVSIEDARRSAQTLELLDDVGRRIAKSIDRIASVALQTSMLSVSGSIEAARAGDAGRGFALVSTDIRKLAHDASENIEAIKDVVQSIRLQIVAVHRDLDVITAGAEAEVVKNGVVLERLAALEVDALTTRQGNDEIRAGAQSVLQAVQDVQVGTAQIATAAQEASAAASEAATAARQQARSAEDLAAAIEEIASLADEMQIAGS